MHATVIANQGATNPFVDGEAGAVFECGLRRASTARYGFRVFACIAAISACLTSNTLAGDRTARTTHAKASKFAAVKWKSHNLSVYGDRFKAALQVQAQQLRKPSWSWADDDREAWKKH
jgi:hypothetical protein